MTSAEGFQRNAQVAGEHQLIVATELTISDQGAGVEVKEIFDEQPETVLADVGYSNERDLSALEARGGYVAPGRESKRTVNRDPRGPGDAWLRSWLRPQPGSTTRNASGCAAGKSLASGASACGVRTRCKRPWCVSVCVCVWRVKRLQPLPAM